MRTPGILQIWRIIIIIWIVLLTWHTCVWYMYMCHTESVKQFKTHHAILYRTEMHVSDETLDWYNYHHKLAVLQHNSKAFMDIDTYMETNVSLFKSWAIESEGFCDGHMWNYKDLFLRFNYISVSPERASRMRRIGGLYHWVFKTFVAVCWDRPHQAINMFSDSVKSWLEHMGYRKYRKTNHISLPGLTIAIERLDVTSTFAVVSDLYDVYLLWRFSRHTYANVLFLDAQRCKEVDVLWQLVFTKTIKLKSIQTETQFDDFIVAFASSDSPLSETTRKPPLLLDFRRYVLDQAGIPTLHTMSCRHDIVRVVFTNLIFEQGSPYDTTSFVIVNMDEILNATRHQFPSWIISNIQWHSMSFRDRFMALSKADILVAPPVPTLAFAFLMQPGSAVLHLLQDQNLGVDQTQTETLLRSSGLYYFRWQSKHNFRIDHVNKTLIIPSYSVIRELDTVYGEMCS